MFSVILDPPTWAPVVSTADPPENDQVKLPDWDWFSFPLFHVAPDPMTAVAAAELPPPPLNETLGADE